MATSSAARCPGAGTVPVAGRVTGGLSARPVLLTS